MTYWILFVMKKLISILNIYFLSFPTLITELPMYNFCHYLAFIGLAFPGPPVIEWPCTFFVPIDQLKVHLHEIFDIHFFSSKASFWSPDQDPKLFSNINSNSPRYSNLKVILRIIRIRGKTFFCHARAK